MDVLAIAWVWYIAAKAWARIHLDIVDSFLRRLVLVLWFHNSSHVFHLRPVCVVYTQDLGFNRLLGR